MQTRLEASLSAGALFVSVCFVPMPMLVVLLNVMLLLMLLSRLAFQLMLMQIINFHFLMHMMVL